LADQIERLPLDEAQESLLHLPPKEGAAVLAEVDEESRPALLENMDARELGSLVRELPHDTAADIISEVAPQVRSEVLDSLPTADRQKVAELLTYPEDTAGGIMSDQFIALREDLTIEQAHAMLRAHGEQKEKSVAYMYVIDTEFHLVGILSIHNLVFSPPDKLIRDIMRREVTHVWVDDDQEKIAQLFDHYHYMALPVTERSGRLVGIVSASQVMDVIRQETTEDMQLMVGLSGEERALTPWRQSVRTRLPWLCINLATAFLAGAVVGAFEETIAAWTALAIFLPIVAGQGGNAGMQTLTVIIRDMALGEMSPGDGKKALTKELLLGLVNGLAIGLIVGVIGYYWKSSVLLGMVVGLAMIMNMLAACLAGVLVPFTLRSLKIDPALASSILVTTVTDVAGFFFFLGLASLVR
jgi:magnesium transporter